MGIISVIIPVYNGENTLRRCLDSILAQTFKHFEVILVDDGSTDNSLLLAKKYAETDKRFVLVSKKNGGVSSARNAGLRLAKGDYIQFIDADDYILPNMFDRMLSVALKTNADMVTCRFKHDCWKPYLPGGEYYMNDRKDCLRFYSDFFTFNVPWNKLFKRSSITASFNENIKIFEDGLFVLENFTKINKVVVLEDILYNYFNAAQDANSAVNAFLKTKFWESRDGYWFKQLLVKKPFESALKKLGFTGIESFIRTRMFDMAFIELVKLIDSGMTEEICANEMFTVFSAPEFCDSLKLFTDKSFRITFEDTMNFVHTCFEVYKGAKSGENTAEPFFEYINCFFDTFSGSGTTIFDIIAQRLFFKLHKAENIGQAAINWHNMYSITAR